jgi:hypothetical protein
MTDLENLLTKVWNPDVRPLTDEAWRCYNAGAIRASIAAAWTAITADMITKLIQLADDGDAEAGGFRAKVVAAQEKGIEPEGVRAMQNIEANLLREAIRFELIDSIGERELERIREDRNLCVHPSLRTSSTVYEPRPEVARGHLAVALTTLLIHPPTQGKKVVDAFLDYTCDTAFVPAAAHIRSMFYDHVQAGARMNIAKLAAKHALCELDPGGRLSAVEYADRAAVVLSAFADRDRDLVRSAVAAQRDRFKRLSAGEVKLRAFGRLGDQDYFWDIVDTSVMDRLRHLLEAGTALPPWEPLPIDVAVSVAMARSEYARERLPELEQLFKTLPPLHRANVVAVHPDPYFVPTVVGLVTDASTYRFGEQAGHILVRYAPFLDNASLRTALTNWAENPECREAVQMPKLAVELFRSTIHLGTGQATAFVEFLADVQSKAAEGDSNYRHSTYPGLEKALRGAGHL